MQLSAEVAEYKISTGKKIFDKEREQAKLEKAESLASNTFNKRSVRELFEHIMSMSRKRQYQILTEQGLTKKPDFICEDKLDFTKARVVFQGVEGAYSEAAMKEFFGSDTDSFHRVRSSDRQCGLFPLVFPVNLSFFPPCHIFFYHTLSRF